MTSKIFRSILSVAALVLIACLLTVTVTLYRYFSTLHQIQLKDELRLAADATELLGENFLENTAPSRYRLTWVKPDGTVIFDSHANKDELENHADRKEIREALSTGSGSSIRHSSTMIQQTVYEALRLEGGTVLRISAERASVLLLVFGMFQPIIIITFLAAGLSAWLAHRMSKRIVEPLNALELEAPAENETYEELSPLLYKLRAQQREIEHQMQELKHRQDEFELITGSMKEALVLLDNKGKVISINPAAKALFALSTDCVGKDFITVNRKAEMRSAIAEAMESGQAFFCTMEKGRSYQFDLNRIDSGENVQGLVILAFDNTAQADAQKQRQEFTANVSHELKTPLQSIIGSAELLENGIIKEDDRPRFLGHIRQEASRLVTLIDDIIRLSQLDEKPEMPWEEVHLKSLSEEVCESLYDAAKLKDVSLKVSGLDTTIYGVRRLLYEAVYNLCDNAIKYNRPGGYVEVSVSQEQGYARLSVKDNGIGISPEHHKKVFERFYRVDKSHSRQSGGTGLGLAIVKHAAEYNHGKISIESQAGLGTEISILFPSKS